MLELDDRVAAPRRRRALAAAGRPARDPLPRPAPAGGFSIFETAPLVAALRSLLLRARPLRPTDVRLAAEATTTEEDPSTIDPTRIEQVRSDLDDAAQDAADYLAALDPLLADPVANRAALVAGVDGFLDDALDVLSTAARFGVPQTGWGFALAWRHAQFATLLDELRARVARWEARLDEFDALVAEYDGPSSPPTVDEKFVLLRRAEMLVSTVIAPQPQPPVPDTLRATLTTKRSAFAVKRR